MAPFHIEEFMTGLTDGFIALVSLWGYLSLKRRWPEPKLYERLYLWFFAMMAVSCFCGWLLNHWFSWLFPPGDCNCLPNWLANNLSLMCFAMAVVFRADAIRPLRCRRALLVAVVVETALTVVVTLLTMSWLWMVVHIGVCLLVFSLPLQIRLWKDGCRDEARWAFIGTAVMALNPAVLIPDIGFSPEFNSYSISHLIITTGMLIFYRVGTCWR